MSLSVVRFFEGNDSGDKMKKFGLKILLLVLVIAVCSLLSCDKDDSEGEGGSGADGTPFEINGVLQVDGTFLINNSGDPIQLRGMSTHGLQWFETCINANSLDVLAYEWGADILRLAIYVQEEGYETDPEHFLGLVDRHVDELMDRGLYALVDWHILNPGNPMSNVELAREFFEHVSATHGDKGHVLYDICNEPSGVSWSEIRSYAMEIIPIIRANDPDGIVIVGTPEWSARPDLVVGNELPFDNVMYSMHFYAAGHGTEHRQIVRDAVGDGIPIFVTEFGTQETSGDGGNDFYSSDLWLDLLEENKISWTNWNYSDDERTGAVYEWETCFWHTYDDDHLKEAGVWIKDRISNPPDDFGM